MPSVLSAKFFCILFPFSHLWPVFLCEEMWGKFGSGVGFPANEQYSNIRIYLIRWLGHSNIRIYSNDLFYQIRPNMSFRMRYGEAKSIKKWLRYWLKQQPWSCFRLFTFMNLLQMISHPFINGFCFNMGHLNALQLVIRMSEYSLREEVIRIFEYSNHSLETLVLRC